MSALTLPSMACLQEKTLLRSSSPTARECGSFRLRNPLLASPMGSCTFLLKTMLAIFRALIGDFRTYKLSSTNCLSLERCNPQEGGWRMGTVNGCVSTQTAPPYQPRAEIFLPGQAKKVF